MYRRPDRRGFTLIEIMIGVTIIGMLAALAIPAFTRARAAAQEETCIANLRTVSGAKQQWGLENFEPADAEPGTDDLNPYIKGGTAKCYCPANPQRDFGSSYAINDLATDPTCKINPANHELD